jgi:hypothetical protein
LPGSRWAVEEKWCKAEVHRIAEEIVLKSLPSDPGKAKAYFDRALAVARQQQVYPNRSGVSRGDSGVAFVAMPQNPPRNVNWASSGRWVHVAKVAFEKYFLHKVRAGTAEPYYEKVMMKLLDIGKIKTPAA